MSDVATVGTDDDCVCSECGVDSCTPLEPYERCYRRAYLTLYVELHSPAGLDRQTLQERRLQWLAGCYFERFRDRFVTQEFGAILYRKRP